MERRRKAGVLKDRAEQCRVFVAVAAALCVDKLRVDAVEVDADAATEEDVEVFERNARHVRAHQGRQRRQRRFKRTGPADAIEVPLEAEGHGLSAGRARSWCRSDLRRTSNAPCPSRVAGRSWAAAP